MEPILERFGVPTASIWCCPPRTEERRFFLDSWLMAAALKNRCSQRSCPALPNPGQPSGISSLSPKQSPPEWLTFGRCRCKANEHRGYFCKPILTIGERFFLRMDVGSPTPQTNQVGPKSM